MLLFFMITLICCDTNHSVSVDHKKPNPQDSHNNMAIDNDLESDLFLIGNKTIHDKTPAEIQIAPDKEDFLIMQSGRSSWAEKKISIMGRLQVYVRKGSQYATWRQFPRAIYFEVVVSPDKIRATQDYSMSISDDSTTYEHYSKMPAEQIIGNNFELNVFSDLSQIIDKAGQYKIRARYFEQVSNWLDITVEP